MKKTHKVVMLPTEKATSELYLNSSGKLHFFKNDYNGASENFTPQHLYILSDEQPKQGDWYIHNQAGQLRVNNSNAIPMDAKKIIATTDTIYKSYQDLKEEDKYKLPQIPESFIQAYIKAYNESKPITEVDLEYEYECQQLNALCTGFKEGCSVCSKIKTRSDNTVIIHRSKMYSREEVEILIKDFNTKINRISGGLALGETSLFRWINQHLQ